ncbi:helix-turn-helix domain-containing protein [Paenibacillus qinlingensis]|uniref:Two-component system response regulator YesN n=1 Tax=Paenibacillus qinlingensis TaxID=1837343 RepID=A0ABU1P2C0_9BACL|nr:helix-turn-helix domain-containing protein [Paenibacillus qinlingensis]MDR6553891.1 two-component system response regulator YesN [Paenibacillus qinlingensis]
MYRVLVAENEPWIRDCIVEMVERAGEEFEVVGEANNGEEALALIYELWPTILLTDICMPEMDGLELIRRLTESRIPMIPVVISGYDNFEYARQAMSYGVTEYLLKPVQFEHISTALHKSVDKLATIKELNAYLMRMQELIEQGYSMESKTLLRKHRDLLETILSMKYLNPSAHQSLLAVYEGKLKSLLEETHQVQLKVKRNNSAGWGDDSEIRQYFQSILDQWIIHRPAQVSQNLKFVVQKACEHIRTHYRDDFTLSELADMANLSISHFGFLFKQQTGCTMIQYINEIRIAESKKLLLETDDKAYRIAELVGFGSLPYFTRVFKAIVGLTPSEYRKSMGL